MRFSGATRNMLPWLYDDIDEIDELFGGDPWPYGPGLTRNGSRFRPWQTNWFLYKNNLSDAANN
jgi:hypothetical protein